MALHALLAFTGSPEPKGFLPPFFHHVYFESLVNPTALGPDGHAREGFRPPIPDRRRLFAGGRLRIAAPLAFGEPAERTAAVVRAVRKHGRTGELVFVTVRSEIRQHGEPAVVDEQDLVYRSGPASAAPESRPASTVDGVGFAPDAITLFQFSALTANSHRIHYDLSYARSVEGYPDLVVHGPLLILAMAERRRAFGPAFASLRYRLHRPLFLGERAMVSASSVAGPDGTLRASVVEEVPDDRR
jgi:hydroxyacyl-ACP dehydratase HTD2-like protein with hotdog domain